MYCKIKEILDPTVPTMSISKSFLMPIFILATALLSACEPSSSRDSLRKSDLVGTKWKLTKLTHDSNVIPFNDDIAARLEFRDDLIGGSSGCNTYRAGWILNRDGAFSLSGPISQTRKGCLESVMKFENRFINVLREGHTIVMSDGILVISSHAGELVFADNK